MNIEKKQGRSLTTGEIEIAKSIFAEKIDYSKVRIFNKSYFPFGLQRKNVAMSPNGNIYFLNTYQPNFSTAFFDEQHLFMHEMSHVWQHQSGMWVRLRGIMSWAVDYKYCFSKKNENIKLLNQYGMEQQASIIADYFVLTTFGMASWKTLNYYEQHPKSIKHLSESELIDNYKGILAHFKPTL